MRAVMLWYGIHYPSPAKYAWLSLIDVSILLKLALIVRLVRRRGYQFPGLIGYMAVCCVSGALYNTKVWGLWGEILLTMGAVLYTLEALHGTSGTVRYTSEVRYIRLSAFALGLMMIGVAILAGPAPFPAYSKLLYYWHLYTVIPCFSVLTYSLAFHFWRGTKIVRPFLANTAIGVVWFAVPILSTELNTGKPFTLETYPWGWIITEIAVQACCIVAWIASITVPNRAHLYPSLP